MYYNQQIIDEWERFYENPPCEDDLGFLDEIDDYENEPMDEEEENRYYEMMDRQRREMMMRGGYHGKLLCTT